MPIIYLKQTGKGWCVFARAQAPAKDELLFWSSNPRIDGKQAALKHMDELELTEGYTIERLKS